MKTNAYDKIKELLDDLTPEEIYATANRIVGFECTKVEQQVDMAAFARRLVLKGMDYDEITD